MARMTGQIGFEEDIKKLFREDDRDCMLANSFPTFDLWDWAQVRDSAARILTRLQPGGGMPPDGPLPAGQIQLFADWQSEGSPKRRGLAYAGFFRDLDSYTEYWDIYRPELNGKYMKPVTQVIFPKVLGPWRAYALAGPADVQAKKDALLAVLAVPVVHDAILLIDKLMMDLIKEHFSIAGGGTDATALVEAELLFGSDTLPLDPDRDAKVAAGDARKPFAKFHRMDGAIMWFNWAAHLESSVLLQGETNPDHLLRTALMAGICGGCSMDFTFRDERLPTRPEYKRDEATAKTIRARSMQIAVGWAQAALECHELFGIAAKPMMANKFFAEGLGRNLL